MDAAERLISLQKSATVPDTDTDTDASDELDESETEPDDAGGAAPDAGSRDDGRASASPFRAWVDALNNETITDAEFDSLVLTQSIKDVKFNVETFCSRLKYPECFTGPARDAALHMLLHGPSGNGKTQLAECVALTIKRAALAAGRQFKVYHVDRGEFNCTHAITFKRIKALFSAAAEAESVTVILFDECDTVMSRHLKLSDAFKSAWQRQFNRSDAILVGMTNHRELINPAILDRFRCEVEVPMPSVAQIRAHIVHTLKDRNGLSAAECDGLAQRFAQRSQGTSVRMVRGHCELAAVISSKAAAEAKEAGVDVPVEPPVRFSDFGVAPHDESTVGGTSAAGASAASLLTTVATSVTFIGYDRMRSVEDTREALMQQVARQVVPSHNTAIKPTDVALRMRELGGDVLWGGIGGPDMANIKNGSINKSDFGKDLRDRFERLTGLPWVHSSTKKYNGVRVVGVHIYGYAFANLAISAPNDDPSTS